MMSMTRRALLIGAAPIALLAGCGPINAVIKKIESEPVPQVITDAAGYLSMIAEAVVGQVGNLSLVGVGAGVIDKLTHYASELKTVAGAIAASPSTAGAQTLYAQAKGIVNALVDGLGQLVSGGQIGQASTVGKVIGWANTLLPIVEALLSVSGVLARRAAATPAAVSEAISGLRAAAAGER